MYTGYGKSAGTTAQVYFILSGDEGESEARHLRDPKRKTFQRRGVDVFLATFPESFGELNYLHIWHNNTGMYCPPCFYKPFVNTAMRQGNRECALFFSLPVFVLFLF